MILIDILDAPARLEGVLARRLLEVRSGMFVGSLSKRAIEVTWEAVVDAKPRSALLVYPSKSELGISIRELGESRFKLTENYGIQLITVVSKSRSRK